MTIKDATVKKSIRLPAELVEYIENCDGKNFNSKLVSILNEFRDGDECRTRRIAEYDNLIQERRIRLSELNKKVNGASMLVNRLQVFCSSAEAAGLLEEPENTTSSIEEREPIPFA